MGVFGDFKGEVCGFTGYDTIIFSSGLFLLEISGGALWGRVLWNWDLVAEVLEVLRGRCKGGASFYSSGMSLSVGICTNLSLSGTGLNGGEESEVTGGKR